MTRHTSPRSARQGFTLIELLVVLVIVGIVSSITLGGFKEMTQGNKRISCQTNLVQIYQAARLYAADEGGKFPYYKQNVDAGTGVCTSAEGTGLWSLYTFPKTSDFNAIAPVGSAPVERYLRSTKVLHCPNDLKNAALYLNPATKDAYNPDYLSYQRCDDEITPNQGSYQSVRTTLTDDSKGPWKRQLLHFAGSAFVARQPTGDTIITWCRFHRTDGKRNMDNVLFYDGSVQLMKMDYGGKTGWKREPKAPQ